MATGFNKGDVWGGLSAAAVMLPQATALGIALWAPYGAPPAVAAIAGLVTALALCLFSGLSAGTSGMVSSPTGPTMVLVSGALASLSAAGYQGSQLVSYLSLMILIAGALQILIGLFNGGRLIKFIPYPVVSGFITGSAILMILSQANILHLSFDAPVLGQGLWIPWVTALITFLAMWLMPRRWPSIPGTVSGLLVGIACYYLMLALSGFAAPQDWVVGRLPELADFQLVIPRQLHDIPWAVILPVSLALALLASLDSLLTSVLADLGTGQRHNARRELAGQGVGQMVAALFGGFAGAGTTGATLVAINSGGRRFAAVVSALAFFLVIALLGPVAALLPISVLAGILLNVAIIGMLDRDILAWLKRSSTRVDAATAILVTTVTVAYDLMIAIAVGLVLAVYHFVRAQITAPVIHRRSTIAQHQSLRRRTEAERELLEQHADKVIIYELKGHLFFGTADRLFEELLPELDRPNKLILDMARISQVDLTAVRMLQQMAERLHKAGGELIFTNVRSGKGLGRKVEKTLRKISPHHQGSYPVKTFIDADEAIEYAENKLLNILGIEQTELHCVQLEQCSLFKDWDKDTVESFRKILDPVHLKSGDYLFRINDWGDDLYIVVSGEIDILLPYGKKHYKRLSKFGPGSFFGEIVLLKPGKRTADARAIHDTELLRLSGAGLKQLTETSPQASIHLLMRLGRELSDRLRWSDSEMRRLAE